jgi:putative transposase
MTRLLQPLFALLASTTDSNLRQVVEYLQEENRILRSKFPKRITVTPQERARLVKLGAALGGALKAIITIVSPRTFARWVAGTAAKARPAAPRRGGRPPTAEDIRNLVIRIANENGWGSLRVAGELHKLGIRNVSRSTVVNILRGAGLDPGPKRGAGTWSEFIKRHAATLWASDFVSVRTLTATGVVELYLLFFIHIGSRKVVVSAPTANPDSAWATQQARNVSIQMQDWNLSCEYLIIDHDAKYTTSFDAIFEAEDAEVIRVGPSAPNLNAYAERWVRTLRTECLDHFLRRIAPPACRQRVRRALQRGTTAPRRRHCPATGCRRGRAADLALPRWRSEVPASGSAGYSSTTTAPWPELVPNDNTVTTRCHRFR